MNLYAPTDPNTLGLQEGLFALLLAELCLIGLVIGLHVARQHRPQNSQRTWLDALSDLVLPHDPAQATLTLRFLVGAANAVIGVLALNYGVTQGVIEPKGCGWLTLTAQLYIVWLYAMLRSGWNRRLSDPSMAEWQLMACVAFLAWGYVLGGVGRPIALLLLFIFLLFNMFTSTMQVLLRASVFSALAFGAAMAHVAIKEPMLPGLDVAYGTAKLQAVYFCVVLVMLVSICLMVNFLTQLRAKSSRRKAELADALARIQDLAMRDELTGLFNRRHMLELLNNEKHRSIRAERAFCIALVDVDHFKSINDTHGHGVGDEVLAGIAGVISGGLRETDVVARWGGEEFLIMFTDTDANSAELVLSRIQMMLAATTVSPQVGELHVTFSAGLTRYAPEEMLTRTIDRADRALYMAKTAGRNRVIQLEAGAPEGNPNPPRRAPAGSGALEHRHAFDVGGMRKHVNRPA